MRLYFLPMRVGHSFLVQNCSFTALVDGGTNGSKIICLLDEKRLWKKHISTVICTQCDKTDGE